MRGRRRELLMHTDVSKVVTESIRAGTPLWESLVPRHVVDEIKENSLVAPPAPSFLPAPPHACAPSIASRMPSAQALQRY